MKQFTARQLHTRPSHVYRTACREPVKIAHQSFGKMILHAQDSIFSIHEHIDGSVTMHLRSLPKELIEEITEAGVKEDSAA